MTKVTFIGAGSTVFAKNLMGDIWSYPELADATICLMDIDAQRLKQSQQVAGHIIKTLGNSPTVECTTDRQEALTGADYVVCMIQVGGYEPLRSSTLRFPRNTACARPSPIRWASAASCAACARSPSSSISRAIWKQIARDSAADQLRQSDVHESVGIEPRQPTSPLWGSATACPARRMSWRATLASHLTRSIIWSPASTTWLSISSSSGATPAKTCIR